METIPLEEQYETDTIFSQDGDVPDSYLQKKLQEVQSDNDLLSDNESPVNDFRNQVDDELLTLNLPTPTAINSDSFQKLVDESKFVWGDFDTPGANYDSVVFQDDLYDVTKDSFRYGRVTSGTSYNLMTGKMADQVLEMVKAKDEEADETLETVTEDENTHLITTEVTIHLNGSGDSLLSPPATFGELYDEQMPKFFEYRAVFPKIAGIWTLLFDQEHYNDMSTFELQASICAALNSKHHLIVCIGVDAYNTVTGVEMTATDRVVFRMALTRAVAGEFQPPLIKVPPKQLTGVSPMKRDVSELTSGIDVLFVPVLGAPKGDGEDPTPNRFLIVVRVKELSDKLYQLSSGRVYIENEGRVVALSSLDEAFRVLIEKNPEQKPLIGSLFMLEPEPFVEDALLDVEEYSSEEDEEEEIAIEVPCEKESKVVPMVQEKVCLQPLPAEPTLSRLEHLQHFGWLLFASAIAYGIYKTVKSR
ncbi:unnamed protein product [Caenorhabditis sp. 36 PRJEB53466]|nr:unnamed protein product [Caenorhabditis sp. 36 PRJEB53466]